MTEGAIYAATLLYVIGGIIFINWLGYEHPGASQLLVDLILLALWPFLFVIGFVAYWRGFRMCWKGEDDGDE